MEWTTLDINFLKKSYSSMSVKEISEILGRERVSVRIKANKLGLSNVNRCKPATEEEKEFIKNNWEKMSNASMAKNLNRTVSSIKAIKHKLGLGKSRIWSQEEIDILVECHPFFTNRDIAETLNKSINAVKNKANRLGLGKKGDCVIGRKINTDFMKY